MKLDYWCKSLWFRVYNNINTWKASLQCPSNKNERDSLQQQLNTAKEEGKKNKRKQKKEKMYNKKRNNGT